MIGMRFKLKNEEFIVQAISEPYVVDCEDYSNTMFICVNLNDHKVIEIEVNKIEKFISDSEWERIRKE